MDAEAVYAKSAKYLNTSVNTARNLAGDDENALIGALELMIAQIEDAMILPEQEASE